ncbi:MAG: hypothetical protein RLP09_22180 [Sandaracinaceae bacterium]
MNESHAQLLESLSAHVFGESAPSTRLLEDGVFPANWVTRYEALVESASHVWASERLWPRELVAAIHFASFYLHARYQAWTLGGGRREKTEAQLDRVRAVSEVFLLGSTSEDRAKPRE